MKRRGVLRTTVLLGGVIGIAGCTEESDSGDDDDSAGDSSGSGGSDSVETNVHYEVRVAYEGGWKGAISYIWADGSSRSESMEARDTTRSQPGYELDGKLRSLSANAQKIDDSSRRLAIYILREGQVVNRASTTASYGAAQVSSSF